MYAEVCKDGTCLLLPAEPHPRTRSSRTGGCQERVPSCPSSFLTLIQLSECEDAALAQLSARFASCHLVDPSCAASRAGLTVASSAPRGSHLSACDNRFGLSVFAVLVRGRHGSAFEQGVLCSERSATITLRTSKRARIFWLQQGRTGHRVAASGALSFCSLRLPK